MGTVRNELRLIIFGIVVTGARVAAAQGTATMPPMPDDAGAPNTAGAAGGTAQPAPSPSAMPGAYVNPSMPPSAPPTGTAQGYPSPPQQYQPTPVQYAAPQQPPGAYGPGYYPNPGAASAATPPSAPQGESEYVGAARGPYFGAWVGSGGPFGGNETDVNFEAGAGLLGTVGYAFIPNFGIDVFVHWNHTARVIPRGVVASFNDNSAHVLLYGAEARGQIGKGPVIGWGSLGISLGNGSATLSSSQPPDSSGFGSSSQSEGDITWKVMPVLAFGAEVEVVKGLSFGPTARLYITSASEACATQRDSFTGPDPTFNQTSSQKQCASGLSSITIPNIAFVGLGLTYRLKVGSD
jgi:hypothetical protein